MQEPAIQSKFPTAETNSRHRPCLLPAARQSRAPDRSRQPAPAAIAMHPCPSAIPACAVHIYKRESHEQDEFSAWRQVPGQTVTKGGLVVCLGLLVHVKTILDYRAGWRNGIALDFGGIYQVIWGLRVRIPSWSLFARSLIFFFAISFLD